jgi:hypothetical protein
VSASSSASTSISASPSSSPSLGTPFWYLASSLTIGNGSITSGTLSDTYTDDGNILVLGETGTGFTYDFTFGENDPVPTPHVDIYFRAWYDGNPAHNIRILQKNWTSGLWEYLTGETNDFPQSETEQDFEFFLINGADYIQDGKVQIRIQHPTGGSPLHQFHIDRMWLQTGGASQSVSASPSISPSASASTSPSPSASPSGSISATPSASPSAAQLEKKIILVDGKLALKLSHGFYISI